MKHKYIDAEKLIAEIERRIQRCEDCERDGYPDTTSSEATLKSLRSFIIIQQEQPIKVYRVENEKEQKGLWRKFDGTWEPLFDMLTDGQCKDMPMEDDPVYREGGKQWFASAPSKKTLQKWFSKRDLEELTAKGFTISEFEVVGHKKISEFEYIFTRDNIVGRTYLKVSDIYPQKQPLAIEKVVEQCKKFGGNPEIIQPEVPSGEDVMTMCNQILIDWVKEGKTQEEKEQREQAHIRFFELYDDYLMQEQPEVDLEKIIGQTYHDGSVTDTSNMDHVGYENIARYFYELGLNARKNE